MKKIGRWLRNLVVLALWSVVFVFVSNTLLVLVWNFDYVSHESWKVLVDYWNSGGVIKSASDLLLVGSLFLLPILWLLGFNRVRKLDYAKMLLAPVNAIYDWINRDTDDNERIVIRNIKSGTQRAEEIKNELESLKPGKAKKAGNIRKKVVEKRTEK
ncbi:MAG: hypothetical protein IJ184_07060 [Alphaproteobacteria bacterium]|nr:hypothetical protein [Alphaproteobacteria bacterium]